MFNKLLAGALTAAIVSVGAVALNSAAAMTGSEGTIEVKPRHGFSQALGSKQAVGFFESHAGHCMVTVMVAEAMDESLAIPPSAVRLQVALEPTESTTIDSAESQMLTITCGPSANTIALKTGATPIM